MERKLAAILAADVVGYSRLMDRDEAISRDDPMVLAIFGAARWTSTGAKWWAGSW